MGDDRAQRKFKVKYCESGGTVLKDVLSMYQNMGGLGPRLDVGAYPI